MQLLKSCHYNLLSLQLFMNQPTFLRQNLSQQLCCTYFQLFLYHQPLGNAAFKMLGLTSLSGCVHTENKCSLGFQQELHRRRQSFMCTSQWMHKLMALTDFTQSQMKQSQINVRVYVRKKEFL